MFPRRVNKSPLRVCYCHGPFYKKRLYKQTPEYLRSRAQPYGGPKVSRQFQFHHGNFNFVHGNFNFITAISISPRQFQLRHGNFNFTTAISTSFTAISISSRQFQFHHGNFNFVTAISISPRQFQLRSRQFQFYHRNFFINSDRPARLSRACFSRF